MEQFPIIYFMIGIGFGAAGYRASEKVWDWIIEIIFWPVFTGYALGFWCGKQISRGTEDL